MMKHLNATREVVFGLFVGLAATLTSAHQQDHDSVSFDILFPQNWYARSLQSCMEVWNHLDQVIGDDQMEFQDRHMLVDAAIGKISYSSSCLETRVGRSQIDDEDIAYLIRLLYSLDDKCEKLAGRQFDDKLSCLQLRIKHLRLQLLELFQSDRTRLGSGD